MDKEKTTLQKIMEQKSKQMCEAIEQAISEGAKVERSKILTNCCTIDGIFIQKDFSGYSVILHFESDKIAKALEPSKDELEKMAEQKRAELEEIEKQINAKQ